MKLFEVRSVPGLLFAVMAISKESAYKKVEKHMIDWAGETGEQLPFDEEHVVEHETGMVMINCSGAGSRYLE